MKIKIVDIVKRPWWQRLFTIDHWSVTVEDEMGGRRTFNAWAGVGSPNIYSLEHSIKKYIHKTKGVDTSIEEVLISKAIGREFVVG